MDWRMRPATRKWWLYGHVVTSVAWIGVELCILALGVMGDQSAHIVAGRLGDLFYFPASALTFVSGVVLSLGTKWELIKHYWVLLKLAATIALLLGGNLGVVPAFSKASELAARGEPIGKTAIMLVTAMSAGLMLLLFATQVSIFKPWKKTRWALTPLSS
ncbi:hypothetical protein AB5J62_35540 [Amycolatopsis sp. cg5]|uniref:hypothetical protein n=1 Tax=Amycolatopsis sp. cg5 TaxID=3238802 RepID=UPI0035261BCD